MTSHFIKASENTELSLDVILADVDQSLFDADIQRASSIIEDALRDSPAELSERFKSLCRQIPELVRMYRLILQLPREQQALFRNSSNHAYARLYNETIGQFDYSFTGPEKEAWRLLKNSLNQNNVLPDHYLNFDIDNHDLLIRNSQRSQLDEIPKNHGDKVPRRIFQWTRAQVMRVVLGLGAIVGLGVIGYDFLKQSESPNDIVQKMYDEIGQKKAELIERDGEDFFIAFKDLMKSIDAVRKQKQENKIPFDSVRDYNDYLFNDFELSARILEILREHPGLSGESICIHIVSRFLHKNNSVLDSIIQQILLSDSPLKHKILALPPYFSRIKDLEGIPTDDFFAIMKNHSQQGYPQFVESVELLEKNGYNRGDIIPLFSQEINRLSKIVKDEIERTEDFYDEGITRGVLMPDAMNVLQLKDSITQLSNLAIDKKTVRIQHFLDILRFAYTFLYQDDKR